MKKYRLLIFILLSFCPCLISAKTCDLKEISDKKKLAREISFSYEYYFVGNNIYYDVTIANVLDDLYVKDTKTGKTYSKKEEVIKNNINNQRLTFEVYSKECDELVATKFLSLPAYNPYYNDPLCEGISEFQYCHKWGIVSSSVTPEVLKAKTEEYRLSLKEKEPEVINYETNITGFYVFVALIILFLLLTFNMIVHDKREKDFI